MEHVLAWLVGFFAVGTLSFWLLFAGLSILMMGLVHFDRSFWATFTFIVSVVLMYELTKVDYRVLFVPWWKVLLPVVYLFPLGFFYMRFRWKMKHLDFSNKCQEVFDNFIRKNNISGGTIPPDYAEQFRNELRSVLALEFRGFKYSANDGISAIHPDDFKEQLYIWWVFWPWSSIAYLLDEPLQKMFRLLYRRVRQSLIDEAESSFQSVKEKIPAPPPTSPKPGPRSSRLRETEI